MGWYTCWYHCWIQNTRVFGVAFPALIINRRDDTLVKLEAPGRSMQAVQLYGSLGRQITFGLTPSEAIKPKKGIGHQKHYFEIVLEGKRFYGGLGGG